MSCSVPGRAAQTVLARADRWYGSGTGRAECPRNSRRSRLVTNGVQHDKHRTPATSTGVSRWPSRGSSSPRGCCGGQYHQPCVRRNGMHHCWRRVRGDRRMGWLSLQPEVLGGGKGDVRWLRCRRELMLEGSMSQQNPPAGARSAAIRCIAAIMRRIHGGAIGPPRALGRRRSVRRRHLHRWVRSAVADRSGGPQTTDPAESRG